MDTFSRIFELIENKGISARSFSANIGLPNNALSEWKKGKAKPSADAITKIADYFGVTADYLMCRTNFRYGQVVGGMVGRGGDAGMITVEMTEEDYEIFKRMKEEKGKK